MIKVVNRKVMFEDGAYKVIKYLVIVFIPAVSTLYFALSVIWRLPDPNEVVGSLAALALFLGTLIHLSSVNYNNSPAAHDVHRGKKRQVR